jgi:hypothetical protein
MNQEQNCQVFGHVQSSIRVCWHLKSPKPRWAIPFILLVVIFLVGRLSTLPLLVTARHQTRVVDLDISLPYALAIDEGTKRAAVGNPRNPPRTRA